MGYLCYKCGKVLCSEQSLHYHLFNKKTKCDQYSCKLCNKNFKTKQGLDLHFCSKKYDINSCNLFKEFMYLNIYEDKRVW